MNRRRDIEGIRAIATQREKTRSLLYAQSLRDLGRPFREQLRHDTANGSGVEKADNPTAGNKAQYAPVVDYRVLLVD